MREPFVYLDHAATTAVRPEVLEAMLPYFTQQYGNPSSAHSFGRTAHRALEQARKQVALAIGCEPREVFFTAGGSESDNWAIRCALQGQRGRHIITSAIEHHAVLHTCEAMEKQGFEVTYLPVDAFGCVRVADVQKAIRPDTALITIMTANNEIGTLQPIREIGEVAKERGILFHTDAVQAVGAIPVDAKTWNVDMLSLSGHKLHAPKGVGALVIRKGVRVENLIYGGAQERGLRAGTENLPSIVGLGKALELANAELPQYTLRVTALRDRLINGILQRIPQARLNGHPTLRLPGNVNVSIPHVEGDALLMRLDLAGIAASGGSACTSGSIEPSHVLRAIGLPDALTRSGLRLTLGRDTTGEEVDYVLATLIEIAKDLAVHNL